MRAIWKGTVSFGLVSIGVNLYAATQDKDVHFHQVHRKDGGRIRYQKVCELDDKEIPAGEIAKGYELDDGEMVVLEDEDFDSLPLTSTHTIDVLEFVPASDIDPIHYAKSYYLEPDRSAKPYALLRDALVDSDVVAIVKVALRQREQLATLRTRDDVLVLNTMLWPDEVRSPSFDDLDDPQTVSKREMEMAQSLIESMTNDALDLSKYHDEYRDALNKVIDAKAEGDETIDIPQPDEGEKAEVIDLMAALERSVKGAKGSRADRPSPAGRRRRERDEADEPADKPTAKKPAKKPAKKAAKKSTTKKAAKKSTTKKAAKKSQKKAS
jgi:DNA end-binding protein Ku